jgi:hypothetical protein
MRSGSPGFSRRISTQQATGQVTTFHEIVVVDCLFGGENAIRHLSANYCPLPEILNDGSRIFVTLLTVQRLLGPAV